MKISVALGVILTTATTAFGGTSGTYKVPEGQFLEHDVFLRAPKVNFDQKSDGTLELKYRLPSELDGKNSREIKLDSVSSGNPLHLKGPEAGAICEPVTRSFSCTIFYHKDPDAGVFPLNTAAANSYMEGRQFSAERMELMGKAQQSIMHEAAGILFIKKR